MTHLQLRFKKYPAALVALVLSLSNISPAFAADSTTTTTTTGSTTSTAAGGTSSTTSGPTSAPVTASQCQGLSDVKEQLLCYITLFTYGSLLALNNLPTYISNWTSADTSDPTGTLQGSFSAVGKDIIANEAPAPQQQQMVTEFFNKTPPVYVNDVDYTTLLNQPFSSPDPRQKQTPGIDPAYNYAKNASGMNITHALPFGSGYNGSSASKSKYALFFTTVSSVQTFNAYLMSQLYTDYKNGNQLSKDQLTLVTQATDPVNWFAQVASENIGIVLRQILMYDSQTYVLMTQLLQTEKQMLTAQAMNNTLLILLNQQQEELLYKRATGAMPE